MINSNNKKMNGRLIKAVVVLCLVLVFGFSFSACEKTQKVTDLSKNVTVLVDFSASTKQARADYAASWETIMKKVNMDDHVFAWKISAHSAMEPRALLDESFICDPPPKNDFKKSQAKRAMRKNIDEAKNKFLTILNGETTFSGKTAIFDSLQVAERSFKNNKKERSVLVILSDMVEDSRYNFERENLTDESIETMIAELKKKQLVPELSGVTVYVVGACMKGAMANEKFNQIKKFWLRYFKETGAILSEENYGSALIGFNE